jgi:hypothetical protein
LDFRTHTDDVLGKSVGIVRDPDKWIAAVSQAVAGFDATQHIVSNLVHTIEGHNTLTSGPGALSPGSSK